jgi:hypothetical protein
LKMKMPRKNVKKRLIFVKILRGYHRNVGEVQNLADVEPADNFDVADVKFCNLSLRSFLRNRPF